MKLKKTLISALACSVMLGATPLTANAQLPLSLFGSSSDSEYSFASMLERVTPAVVSIDVQGRTEVTRQVPDIYRFFGYNTPRQYKEKRPFKSLGSGVIIDADKGYIVTNNHVVNGAETIHVTLKNGKKIEAKLIGADPASDIALIQVQENGLTEMAVADSNQTRVGDIAIAIGNPFGLTQTVTAGIISAKGRSNLNIGGERKGLEDFIQTDAAINSGNSGGALVNHKGELIGINTAIYGPNGGNVGIGFAIPSNMMKNLINQIIEYGEVRRGRLGVVGNDLTSELAEAMELDVSQGAFISEVVEDSPAQQAGLQSGDVIVSVNGVKIKGFGELASKVSSLGAGSSVTLGLYRNGDEMSVDVTLASVDSEASTGEQLHEMLSGAEFMNGTTANGSKGIVLESLENRSPAARLGLQEGDIIIAVNRKRTETLSQLKKMLSDPSGVIALQIQRGNSTRYLLIQ